ncbi:uncharacterized protein LOC110119034 [Ceratitis capitata]|uniref:uncharacterized protein LOC110119034 n=1 Tax=Ceratitis capitata TaxID=7213 RepID=UPI000A11C28B|nr:uncharacterized protein LOC110119034 [Ceratitis capitata]
MTSAEVAFLIIGGCLEIIQIIKRKSVRNKSNPLELPESTFIDQYRLNKKAFVMVLDVIEVYHMCSNLQPHCGFWQKARINSLWDSNICLARHTLSEIITKMLKVFERLNCPRWIILGTNDNGKRRARDILYRVPGIAGCIFPLAKKFADNSVKE